MTFKYFVLNAPLYGWIVWRREKLVSTQSYSFFKAFNLFKIHSQMAIKHEFDGQCVQAKCQPLWVLFWRSEIYWYIILSVNIFSSLKQTFDFWCLPEDLTRIIKLIYSHIRNWSLNWWIFKAINVVGHRSELISSCW